MIKPITIGDINFSKKGDAVEYFRSMLYKYNPGDKVSKDDQEILETALRKHPEADEKIGCGLTNFSVRSGGFGTRCFWINRKDGSTEKFSFRSCLN